MPILFCAQTMGFYPRGLSGDAVGLPAVEVSQAEYQALLGGVIEVDASGFPRVALPVPPTLDQLRDMERAWRDLALSAAAGLRERHRDQLEIGADTTLTAEQFTELLVYMQALRDWPQSEAFPDSSQRPVAPPWTAEQSQ